MSVHIHSNMSVLPPPGPGHKDNCIVVITKYVDTFETNAAKAGAVYNLSEGIMSIHSHGKIAVVQRLDSDYLCQVQTSLVPDEDLCGENVTPLQFFRYTNAHYPL